MEFALVLRELSRRRLALAIGVLVAIIAAVFSVYRPVGLGLKPRALQYSSATTQVFIDTPSSVLGNLTQSLDPLQARATVYANFMASPTVLSLIGEKAGIPGDQIYAAGPVDPLVPRIVQEPTAVQRNVEISGETTPYRLNFNNDPNLPTIGIYAQAPTTAESVRLAEASVQALKQYVAGLQSSENVPAPSRAVIRQLGSANGHVVDGGIGKALMCIVFLVVFLLWCVMTLVVVRFRENWRESAILAEDGAREDSNRQLSIIDPDPRGRNGEAEGPEIGNRNGQQSAERHSTQPPVGAMRATRIRPSGTS
jgi:hypothetical protein